MTSSHGDTPFPRAGVTTSLRLYSLLTRVGAPVLRSYLHRRAARGKEDADRIEERFGHPSAARPDGPVVWVHGVSVGESLSALPLIERILAAAPDAHVLMTTATTTSASLMARRLPRGAFHQYVPLDTPQAVREFLDYWQPSAALFMESELWPNMLLEADKRGIELILLNARMSERSFNGWLRARATARSLLSRFSLCLAQDTSIGGRLESLGAQNVQIVGNLKYAADPLPADEREFENIREQVGDRKVWLAASTHDGEERIVGHAHAALKEAKPDILSIVVPRHPDRGPAIKVLLEDMGHKVSLRSLNEPILPQTDIYIADTIGELGLFYRMTDIVLVGGSLIPHGGQNPLEPARLHSAVLTGPNTENFHEVFRELTTAGAAEQVQNPDQLILTLRRLLSSNDDVRTMAEAGLRVCGRADSVIGRVMHALQPLIARLNAITMADDEPLRTSDVRDEALS